MTMITILWHLDLSSLEYTVFSSYQTNSNRGNYLFQKLKKLEPPAKRPGWKTICYNLNSLTISQHMTKTYLKNIIFLEDMHLAGCGTLVKWIRCKVGRCFAGKLVGTQLAQLCTMHLQQDSIGRCQTQMYYQRQCPQSKSKFNLTWPPTCSASS